MTPKYTALELVSKYYLQVQTKEQQKQCALIVIDEVINVLNDDNLYIQGETNIDGFINYWQEVKQEIEKL